MDIDDLPPSDLAKLRDEVLVRPAEFALPSHLSDHWLQLICRDLDALAGEGDIQLRNPAAAPLALILHILSSRVRGSPVTLSMQALHRCYVDYRIEIALEMVRRQAGIGIEPATILTIFTDREVAISDGAVREQI